MHKVLVLVSGEEQCREIEEVMQNEFCIRCCTDSRSAMGLVRVTQPDVLVIELAQDTVGGFAFLKELDVYRPPLVIGLNRFADCEVVNQALEYGIQVLLRHPCPPELIRFHVCSFIRQMKLPESDSLRQKTAAVLIRLGFKLSRKGARLLLVGLPIFARDPDQTLNSELFPQLMKLCNYSSTNSVDKAISNAIEKAWADGDRAFWRQLFPNSDSAPTNREFLTNVVEYLNNDINM